MDAYQCTWIKCNSFIPALMAMHPSSVMLSSDIIGTISDVVTLTSPETVTLSNWANFPSDEYGLIKAQ